MWREKNFKNKINTNWFDKNPENINKKWRPKKLINSVIFSLEKEWITKVSKTEVSELITLLLNLSESELKKLLVDQDNPMIIRVIIKNILNNKWFETINILLDRVYWKATQTVNNLNIDVNKEIDVLKDKLKDLK